MGATPNTKPTIIQTERPKQAFHPLFDRLNNLSDLLKSEMLIHRMNRLKNGFIAVFIDGTCVLVQGDFKTQPKRVLVKFYASESEALEGKESSHWFELEDDIDEKEKILNVARKHAR